MEYILRLIFDAESLMLQIKEKKKVDFLLILWPTPIPKKLFFVTGETARVMNEVREKFTNYMIL